MSDIFHIKHPIDVHIMSTLSSQEFVRFVDLKDKKTDTNLLTYHLKKLQTYGYVQKVNQGYTIGQKSIAYLHNLTKHVDDPEILVNLLVQNSEGDILLVKRTVQPFINTWTLPCSTLGSRDLSIADAVSRIGDGSRALRHVGDAYVRVVSGAEVIYTSLSHVFRTESDDYHIAGDYQWIQPHRLTSERLAPGTEQIITRSFFGDAFFFEEYEEAIILV